MQEMMLLRERLDVEISILCLKVLLILVPTKVQVLGGFIFLLQIQLLYRAFGYI